MSSFFDRMLGRGRDSNNSSANKAKERLQFVLVHDRINLPPEQLQAMKQEILEVISKYVEIAAEEVAIALQQDDRNTSMIVAEIPFSVSHASDSTDENDDLPSPDDDQPIE
jgi:cell division topological specificity factor